MTGMRAGRGVPVALRPSCGWRQLICKPATVIRLPLSHAFLFPYIARIKKNSVKPGKEPSKTQ